MLFAIPGLTWCRAGFYKKNKQEGQLSQRNRAASFVSFGQNRYYWSIFDHFDIIGPIVIEFSEITADRCYYAVQVIQGHRCRYQSKTHMRLPISD